MQQIAESAPTSGTARNQVAPGTERLWIIAVGAMVVIQLWFGMISSSFWLDETGTWWIVKDGAAETVRRSFFWSGQSPLFYLIAWSSSRLFGLNEIALRIPSVLAMTGAIYFLYRIAERIYDRAGAAAVAFVFLCVASFYAVDARPYALGMFFLTASTWALLRWLDTNRPLHGVLYTTTAALVVYTHCVLSLGLVAGISYGVATLRKEPRRLAWLGLFQLAIVLLSLPLVPELRTFYAARSTHTFTRTLPTAGDLLVAFIPCSLAGALILLTWIYTIARGHAGIAGKCTARVALLVGTWSLFAPLLLFLLPLFSDLRMLVDRYYSSSLPGQALLAGGLLASIRPPAVRKALILMLGAASIYAQGRMTVNGHGNDDWRGALQFVRKEAGAAPVLLVSGFVEASDFAALRDPKLRDVLFAPEQMYGEPARSIRLPNLFDGRGNKDMESIARQLQSEPRFFLLTGNSDRSYEMWLLGRLAPRCRSDRYFWVVRFTCD
jgi:4-amino-4-deoxy-L-arabinose transferase-like glycosyltransferase